MGKSYTYDNAWVEERKRLDGIEAQYDAATIGVLERIGMVSSWACLEVGAGGGSVARWLSERAGQVVATDLDPRFVAAIDAPNLEARRHDVVAEPLEENAFDLVHSRMLLEHLPERAAVAQKLAAALKPGGWLVLEEIDASLVDTTLPLAAYPEGGADAFRKVSGGVVGAMRARGFDPHFARRLPELFRQLGLVDIEAISQSHLTHGGSDAAAFPRWTMIALRDALVSSGAATSAEIDDAVRLVDDPGFSWMRPPIISAWARRAS